MFYAALQQLWSRKKRDFFQFTLAVSVNAILVNFGISCYFGSDGKAVAATFLKLIRLNTLKRVSAVLKSPVRVVSK